MTTPYDQQTSSPGPKDPNHLATAVEPSGPKGSNPATAGPGDTGVQSTTPENREGRLNPSSPEDSNATPGTTPRK